MRKGKFILGLVILSMITLLFGACGGQATVGNGTDAPPKGVTSDNTIGGGPFSNDVNAAPQQPGIADQWIDNVELTWYTVALERDLSGQKTGNTETISNLPNINGTFYKEFLYSGWGVAMQGTGISLDQRYIKYVTGGGGWNQNKTWLNDPSTAVFTESKGVIGKSERVLQEWYSVAVDPSIIPLDWYVWIDSEQVWFRADDKGGLITGKHIDIYAGLSAQRPVSNSSRVYIQSSVPSGPPTPAPSSAPSAP